MNKLKHVVIALLGLIILTGCGSSKLDSVAYELKDINGIESTITFEYDKDKNIQTAVTKSKINFKDVGQTKDFYEEAMKSGENIYENMTGVKHTFEITDTDLNEELNITVKDVSKESLPVLFAAAAKDGKVALDDYTTALESVGYTKK